MDSYFRNDGLYSKADWLDCWYCRPYIVTEPHPYEQHKTLAEGDAAGDLDWSVERPGYASTGIVNFGGENIVKRIGRQRWRIPYVHHGRYLAIRYKLLVTPYDTNTPASELSSGEMEWTGPGDTTYESRFTDYVDIPAHPGGKVTIGITALRATHSAPWQKL